MMNQNKKIIFVITKSNFGGAQRYVFDLAREFKNKGYEVKVALGGKGILSQKLSEESIETVEIPYMQRDISLIKEIKTFIFLYSLFRKENPQVVHLNSSKAGGLGALAAKIAFVPKIIFTLHGLALNEDRNLLQKTIIKVLYWITISLSHKTIAVSNALKLQLKNTPFIKNKIKVIHNGIPAQRPLSKEESRNIILDKISGKRPVFEPEAIILGTIGELHPIKGHCFLLEGFKLALKESPIPFYLFIVGEGQEKTKLQKIIAELGLQDKAFLCGEINNVSRVLKAFDIFVLPSVSEGLPYVILEAGLSGIPVIASDVGGIPEIIQNEVSGILIKPKSPLKIKEAIISLSSEQNKRESLGHRLQETIQADFSTQKMILETEILYK